MAKNNRMKSKPKLSSAFLAVLLLITAFSTTAFADGGTTTLTTTVPCTVTLQIGEHGAVTVDGTKYTGNTSFQAELDAVVTYTITPDSGYEISKVTYDGTDVTASAKSGTYKAAELKGNVTVTVTFARKGGETPTDPTMPTSPKTGDQSRPILWAALLASSVLAFTVLLYVLKRRKART